jgi:hypothetical protein
MATVTKDFKIKSGLIVEGANATVDGSDIITEDIITGGTQTNISVTYNANTKTLDFVAESGLGDGTTDDLQEGTENLYFTDVRAKGSAADLLVNANKTNITITGNEDGLTITAENGVADSDTDDLTEGSTNLYFTNQRALDATSAAYDAAGSAAAAQTAAEGYADGLASNYDPAGSASTVQTNLDNHALDTSTHGVTGDIVGTTDEQTLTNKTFNNQTSFFGGINLNASKVTNMGAPTSEDDAATKGYVDGLASNYDPAGSAATAEQNANDYTDTAIGNISSTLDIAGDTGTDSVNLGSDTLTFAGGDGIDIAVTNNTVTVDIDSTVVTLDGAQTLTNKTLGDDLLMDGNQISGLGTPTQANHAATKSYVDAIAEGLHIHASAAVATTANIADLSDGPGTIDGVTLNGTLDVYTRVLVKSQTTASQNGIYVATKNTFEKWVYTRATDFDSPAEVDGGDFIFVTEGTLYNNTGWVQTTTGVTVIGTDPIEFTQFSGAGTYTAGYGLTLDGGEFAVDTDEIATVSVVNTKADAEDPQLTLTEVPTLGAGLVFNSATGPNTVSFGSNEAIEYDGGVRLSLYGNQPPSPFPTFAENDVVRIFTNDPATSHFEKYDYYVSDYSTGPTSGATYNWEVILMPVTPSQATEDALTAACTGPTAWQYSTPVVSIYKVVTEEVSISQEIGFLEGLRSNIQEQLDTKPNTLAVQPKERVSNSADSGGYIDAWAERSRKCLMNTSSATTSIGLVNPAFSGYQLGDEIQIVDISNNAATNNITVYANGNKINGLTDDLVLDTDGVAITLVYTGTAQGWVQTDLDSKGYVDAQLDSYLNSTSGSEGTTILYVQDYVDTAIETGDATATPTYLAVDINSVATQVASTATTTGGSAEVVYDFADTFRSAKFLVKLSRGTHTEVSEVLLTLDTGNNIAITEYAVVGTNGSLGTISAAYNATSDKVELTVDTPSATTVKVAGTLLA